MNTVGQLERMTQERVVRLFHDQLGYRGLFQAICRINRLAGKVQKPTQTSDYPASLDTPARRALYDNLNRDETQVDEIFELVRNQREY